MIAPFSKLRDILNLGKTQGCFVDTSILFSATYSLDPRNEESEDAFNCLSEFRVPVVTNVNVRSEFLENHRRILIAECLIDFLEDMGPELDGPLHEKLKSHRAAYRKKIKEEKSVKIDVNQIKMFRKWLSSYKTSKENGWVIFCRNFLHGKLSPIWPKAEKELDLNFISLRSQDHSPYLNSNPEWEKAVDIMGRYGIASADAMIVNMFLCSKIPVLLTADMEMAECATKEAKGTKQIFVPDSAIHD